MLGKQVCTTALHVGSEFGLDLLQVTAASCWPLQSKRGRLCNPSIFLISTFLFPLTFLPLSFLCFPIPFPLRIPALPQFPYPYELFLNSSP